VTVGALDIATSARLAGHSVCLRLSADRSFITYQPG
jgi:hypothetical protein